jgi:hypothetical protein
MSFRVGVSCQVIYKVRYGVLRQVFRLRVPCIAPGLLACPSDGRHRRVMGAESQLG